MLYNFLTESWRKMAPMGGIPSGPIPKRRRNWGGDALPFRKSLPFIGGWDSGTAKHLNRRRIVETPLKISTIKVNVYSLLLYGKDVSSIKEKLYSSIVKFPYFANQALILDLYKLEDLSEDELEVIVGEISSLGFNILGMRHSDKKWSSVAMRLGLNFYPVLQSEIDEMEEKGAGQLAGDINNHLEELVEKEEAEGNDSEDESSESSDGESEDDENEEDGEFDEDEETEDDGDEDEDEDDESDEDDDLSEEELERQREIEAGYVWMRPPLVIDKPVRSGQQYYAEKSDIIVNAVVNEGAEIIADGNIHVYSIMRGRALAGASGDTSARIFILNMQAQLVSVAGVYRTFDSNLPSSLHKKAVTISLTSDKRLAIKAMGDNELI